MRCSVKAEFRCSSHRSGEGHHHGAFGVDDARAFDMLRRLSQESNTKLVDIA
jgi:hypothetical protein